MNASEFYKRVLKLEQIQDQDDRIHCSRGCGWSHDVVYEAPKYLEELAHSAEWHNANCKYGDT